MISEAALSILGLVFAALAVAALVAWLGHAVWSTLRENREARRRPEALRAVAAALQSGDVAAALAVVKRLSGHQALDVLVEMAHTVAGTQRERLDELARRWGILDRADRWGRSMRWHRRLRAARLITIFGVGEESCGDALLRDPNADVRAQAAEWAGAHPNPARITRLIEMLGDPELRCQFAAREGLADAGPAAIVELAAALPSLGRPAVAGALEAARSVAVPDFLPAALGRTREPDPDIRARGAKLAAAIGGPEAAQALERLAADPEADVRAAAAAGLGHLGRWQSAGSVADLLDDPNWRTRRAAALSLRRMGPTGELLLRRRCRGEGPPADTARSALELPPVAAAVEEEELVG